MIMREWNYRRTYIKGNFEKYGHYPPGIESLKWHQEKINNGIYHQIQKDGNLVGGIYITSQSNSEMKIEFLFLSPDYQGRKIGATVMALVEDDYKEVKKWFLLTPNKDFRNHHFYEKHGFRKVGELRPDENSDFKLFQYEKEIDHL
jgi:N-acetylglutamate synthase-like GNAT family acetyltransferase